MSNILKDCRTSITVGGAWAAYLAICDANESVIFTAIRNLPSIAFTKQFSDPYVGFSLNVYNVKPQVV